MIFQFPMAQMTRGYPHSKANGLLPNYAKHWKPMEKHGIMWETQTNKNISKIAKRGLVLRIIRQAARFTIGLLTFLKYDGILRNILLLSTSSSPSRLQNNAIKEKP